METNLSKYLRARRPIIRNRKFVSFFKYFIFRRHKN